MQIELAFDFDKCIINRYDFECRYITSYSLHCFEYFYFYTA